MTLITPIISDTAAFPVKSPSLHCTICPARKFGPCGGFKNQGCNTLSGASARKEYGAHEAIYRSGDTPDRLVTIMSGVVALSATLEDGRTQILSLHFRGDVIGRTDGQGFAHDLIAMTSVRICHIDRDKFLETMGENEGFRQRFVDKATATLEETRNWMLTLGRKNAKERVATLLVVLALRGQSSQLSNDEDAYRMTLPLTREEIANHLGLTIATISRAFTKLRKEGHIQVVGKVVTIPALSNLISQTGHADATLTS